MADRAETLPDGCEAHGIPAYRDEAGTVHIATGARCIGPDPERDVRIDTYRDRERRRAARALDRYFDVMHNGVEGDPAAAGERFVEQVGDYVLARLGHNPSVVQHKSHYDVPPRDQCPNGMPDGWGHLGGPGCTNNADHGVPSGVQGGQWVNDETGVPGSYEPDSDARHHNADHGVPSGPADSVPDPVAVLRHAAGCNGAFGVPCEPWCEARPA